MTKKEAIIEAITLLGDCSAQDIVLHVKSKAGMDVSQVYVYMVRSQHMKTDDTVTQAAQKLLKAAGSKEAAMYALHKICGESRIAVISDYYLNQIEVLEAEMRALPEDVRAYHEQEIKTIRSRLQGVRNLVY